MAIINTKTALISDIKSVWNIVTSLENYSWRSDISKITVISETQFIEHTKDGFQTKFTINCKEECNRYEFDMENENMKGHWTGFFKQQENQTIIDFTENVTVKKILMRPFAKMYLRKQQSKYIEDLRKALGE